MGIHREFIARDARDCARARDPAHRSFAAEEEGSQFKIWQGALVARSGLLGQAKRGCVPLPDFPPPTLSTGNPTISKFRYSITNSIEQRNRDTLDQPQSWLTPTTYVLHSFDPCPSPWAKESRGQEEPGAFLLPTPPHQHQQLNQ